MISSLGDLRIVPLECLILHEDHDHRRLEHLRERMEAEGVQRNPVIAAPYKDRYLVLDGAHRVHALGEMGCSMALIQLVELPEKAEGWGHILDVEAARSLPDLGGAIEVSEEPEGVCLAEIETDSGRRVYVRAGEEGLLQEVAVLWRMQEIYPGDVPVRRVNPGGPTRLANGEALVAYRGFTPKELVEIVQAGMMLPAGITRFRIPERVLGVRFPLEKLESGDPETRDAELRAFVKESWEANRIRYYGEPVVLFE
ncbi:MAG: ParB N-terminal domain-containing protein [Rubrobacteraceae bacterium]